MKYREFGERTRSTIILLHCEGLSWWSLKNIIYYLKMDYHVITPIIDGHGEDGSTTFISIQDSAKKLIQYIDDNYNGKIFAIGGLSLGAQIIIEVLSKRADIAEYSILESGLVTPAKCKMRVAIETCKPFYWLMRKRWFAKLQASALCIKQNMFEQYYKDSLTISRKSLSNIVLSIRSYTVPDELKNTKTKALIIFGFKERKVMDRSVHKLMETIPNSQVCIAPGMRRGELCLVYYMEYLALIKNFMA